MKKFLLVFGLVALVSGCSNETSERDAKLPEGTHIESQRDYDRFVTTIIVDEKSGKRFIIADYGSGVGIAQIME